jgi:hypothetical protein
MADKPELERYFDYRPVPKNNTLPTPPEPPYHWQTLPLTTRNRSVEYDPHSGMLAPAFETAMPAIDAFTGRGPPLRSSDIADTAIEAAGMLPTSVRAFTARVTRPPRDQDLFRRGNATIDRLSGLNHPPYPTGYQNEGGLLGHFADTAQENFPLGATPKTSPETFTALERLRNKPGGPPKPDPVADANDAMTQARMDTDPALGRMFAQMKQLSAEYGERASGPPLTLGELIRMRENLPHHEPGAPEARAEIDNAIYQRNDFGVGDAYRNARGNLDAADASITAAGTPNPGAVRRTMLNTANALEQGGPLTPSLTGIGAALVSHAAGMPGWLTAVLGAGGVGTGAKVPGIGQALGGVVRSLAGKPIPQGEFGPAAVAARTNSPMFREVEGSIVPYSPPGGGLLSPRAQLAQALMLQDAANRAHARPAGPEGPYDWVRGAPPAPPQQVDYNDPENSL